MDSRDSLFEKVTNRETIFQGCYLTLERLQVSLSDGRDAVREIVRLRDAVAVLPLDKEGNVVMVLQHRAAIGRTLLEVPAGLIEDQESMFDAAIRECEEETGYRPKKVQKLISYAQAEGYSTGFVTLFLGTDLEYTGKIHLDATEHVETVTIHFLELMKQVKENKILDTKTMLSVLLSEPLLSLING